MIFWGCEILREGERWRKGTKGIRGCELGVNWILWFDFFTVFDASEGWPLAVVIGFGGSGELYLHDKLHMVAIPNPLNQGSFLLF